MKSRLFFSVLLVIIMVMTGCARFIKPEKYVTSAAGELLERIDALNTRRSACKGIGTISFKNALSMPRMRFAWLCSLPDRIRMELLAPTGNPLLTLSADGTYFYYQARDKDNRLYKKKADGISLKKIISIPLTIRDTTHLLAGAIPLFDFDRAERIDLPDGQYRLRLKGYWPDRTEEIFFDKDTGEPVGLAFFRRGDDAPDYSVRFTGSREVNGIFVPRTITLEGSGGQTVVIAIDRFWPETDVPVEKFILTNPS